MVQAQTPRIQGEGEATGAAFSTGTDAIGGGTKLPFGQSAMQADVNRFNSHYNHGGQQSSDFLGTITSLLGGTGKAKARAKTLPGLPQAKGPLTTSGIVKEVTDEVSEVIDSEEFIVGSPTTAADATIGLVQNLLYRSTEEKRHGAHEEGLMAIQGETKQVALSETGETFDDETQTEEQGTFQEVSFFPGAQIRSKKTHHSHRETRKTREGVVQAHQMRDNPTQTAGTVQETEGFDLAASILISGRQTVNRPLGETVEVLPEVAEADAEPIIQEENFETQLPEMGLEIAFVEDGDVQPFSIMPGVPLLAREARKRPVSGGLKSTQVGRQRIASENGRKPSQEVKSEKVNNITTPRDENVERTQEIRPLRTEHSVAEAKTVNIPREGRNVSGDKVVHSQMGSEPENKKLTVSEKIEAQFKASQAGQQEVEEVRRETPQETILANLNPRQQPVNFAHRRGRALFSNRNALKNPDKTDQVVETEKTDQTKAEKTIISQEEKQPIVAEKPVETPVVKENRGQVKTLEQKSVDTVEKIHRETTPEVKEAESGGIFQRLFSPFRPHREGAAIDQSNRMISRETKRAQEQMTTEARKEAADVLESKEAIVDEKAQVNKAPVRFPRIKQGKTAIRLSEKSRLASDNLETTPVVTEKASTVTSDEVLVDKDTKQPTVVNPFSARTSEIRRVLANRGKMSTEREKNADRTEEKQVQTAGDSYLKATMTDSHDATATTQGGLLADNELAQRIRDAVRRIDRRDASSDKRMHHLLGTEEILTKDAFPMVAMNTLPQPNLRSIRSTESLASNRLAAMELGRELVSQIRISQALLNDKQEVRINLKNEVLAGSEVVIGMDGKTLTVAFNAANGRVAELLLHEQQGLRQQLLDNLNLEKVSISVRDGSRERDLSEGHDEREERQRREREAEENKEEKN